jgi:serine phosphatase RsbU (regulator of sigma subunit)
MTRPRLRLPPWNADVAALTTAAVFGVLLWWIFHTVAQAGLLESRVRQAQVTRGTVLRAQVDQETSVRAYLVTGKTSLLQPFYEGRTIMATRLDQQLHALQALGSHVAPITIAETNDQRLLNRQWRAEIAEPLIADRRRTDVPGIAERGIGLIDRFRADNDRIADALSLTSAAADHETAVALKQIGITGIVGAIGLIVLVRLLTWGSERFRRAAERQRLLYESEKRLADSLQQAFLQRSLPDIPSIGMNAVYMPAEQQARVGGDWYDAIVVPNGKLFISVGDVSGHGVEAAVTMSRARQTLLTLATLGLEPGAMLADVNTTLLLQGQKMVTAFCCYIDPLTFEIEYGNAGHPPPAVVAPGAEADMLRGGGVPIGILPNATYSSYRVRLTAGSLLVLYTDGLVEYNRDLIAGVDRLLLALTGVAASGAADPARALSDAMFSDGRPFDDVAVLTLRFLAADAGRANGPALAPPAAVEVP